MPNGLCGTQTKVEGYSAVESLMVAWWIGNFPSVALHGRENHSSNCMRHLCLNGGNFHLNRTVEVVARNFQSHLSVGTLLTVKHDTLDWSLMSSYVNIKQAATTWTVNNLWRSDSTWKKLLVIRNCNHKNGASLSYWTKNRRKKSFTNKQYIGLMALSVNEPCFWQECVCFSFFVTSELKNGRHVQCLSRHEGNVYTV